MPFPAVAAEQPIGDSGVRHVTQNRIAPFEFGDLIQNANRRIEGPIRSRPARMNVGERQVIRMLQRLVVVEQAFIGRCSLLPATPPKTDLCNRDDFWPRPKLDRFESALPANDHPISALANLFQPRLQITDGVEPAETHFSST
jgi:hypothetical protein